MKCFEVTKCSEKDRADCYVWKTFGSTPQEMEQIQCWLMRSTEGTMTVEQRCSKCEYYKSMHSDTGVSTGNDSDLSLIHCEGVINSVRTAAIKKVWEEFKKNGKYKVILDLASVNNIYSSGLGAVIQMHKDCESNGGILYVISTGGYVSELFESTKLSRLLHIVGDRRAATDAYAVLKEKIDEKKAAVAKPAVTQSTEKPPRCWEYFNGHNPANATNCDECFRKLHPSDDPCWIVEGVIEGVSFKYVNEECDGCEYFAKYGGTIEL